MRKKRRKSYQLYVEYKWQDSMGRTIRTEIVRKANGRCR